MIELLLALVDLLLCLVAYMLGDKTWDELREERRARQKIEGR